MMNAWDAVGYLAAGLVFGAFCMRNILHLRIVGVASNAAFLAYGIALGLTPVWVLHLVLLPVNLVRLWQIGSRMAKDAARDHGESRVVASAPQTRNRRPKGRRLSFLPNCRSLRSNPRQAVSS